MLVGSKELCRQNLDLLFELFNKLSFRVVISLRLITDHGSFASVHQS